MSRSIPRKRSGTLELDLGDGVILYNQDSKRVHHLNPSASIVWHLLDGRVAPNQMATEIAEEYGVDASELVAQIDQLITEFEGLGLIEVGPAGAGEAVPSSP